MQEALLLIPGWIKMDSALKFKVGSLLGETFKKQGSLVKTLDIRITKKKKPTPKQWFVPPTA